MLSVPLLLLLSHAARAEAPAALAPPARMLARVELVAELAGGAPALVPGVSGGFAVPFAPAVDVEVEALLGYEAGASGADGADPSEAAGGALRGGALLGVRFPLRGGLSVAAGAGESWRDGAPGSFGRAGLAWDLPVGAGRARLAVGADVSARGAAAVVALGGSLALAPRDGTTTGPASPRSARSAARAPLEVPVDDALVWVPHPVCAWLPPEEAAALIAASDPELPVEVHAPGHLPAALPPDASGTVELAPVPTLGAVLVVAYPGDRVSIAGRDFALGEDGTAVFAAQEGAIRVDVVGGGRRAALEGAVAPGHALWLRAPPPLPLVVSFPTGSAILPADAGPRLAALVADAGSHRFRVVGSSSGRAGEGEDRLLAEARAEALKRGLLAAGLPPDAIGVLTSVGPGAAAPPTVLEGARVEPILPAEPP